MTTKKKTTKKTKAQLAKLEAARVKRANAAFAKMTPAQKRVQIAKDVIAQLDAKKIVAEYGSWLSPDGQQWFRAEADQQVRDFIGSTTSCEACALGSIFMCAVTRADELKVADLAETGDPDNSGKTGVSEEDVFGYLERFFDHDRLQEIETAFEGGRGVTMHSKAARDWRLTLGDIPEPATVMRAIMANIIKHRGQFNVNAKPVLG